MKICAVIVTYGDRFHLLKQVMEACYKEGVDKIIVVDNASEQNSRYKLKEYESKNQERLKVIYLDENTGSAGGYKRGLQEAYNCSECEFIWLLDDDNMPQKDSLKVLKEFWNRLDEKNKKERISLLSYRPDRVQYKEAIMTNNPDLVLGRKNSFLGFHILDLPKKVMRVIKRKMGMQTFTENLNIKSGKVTLAPYGGMFFHKNLVDTIGYPREELFVYSDDFEWSYRIIKKGGFIYLVLGSVIKEIDISWNMNNNHSYIYNYVCTTDENRLYYSVRNRVFFEKKEKMNNLLMYKLNKFMFYLVLSSYSIFFFKFDKIKKIHKAIKDAEEL